MWKLECFENHGATTLTLVRDNTWSFFNCSVDMSTNDIYLAKRDAETLNDIKHYFFCPSNVRINHVSWKEN